VQRSGGRERQRWRCTLPDGSYHRFLGAMSRTRAHDETCVECENHLEPHQGPAAPAAFEYLVREVAGGLVSVGRGMSYTDAAKRVRMAANVGKTAALREVTAGQTVAEWMADFVPVVAARHQPTEWPAVLLLDSTRFQWTNRRTGQTHDLFSVLGAYGYDADGKRGRLWKLAASPTNDGPAWEEFLASLPGRPQSVVCDRDLGIIGAVQRHWGRGKNAIPIHLCEYHLLSRARKALKEDGLAWDHPVWELLNNSLQTPTGWIAFENALLSDPSAVHGQRWVNHWRQRLRTQTQRRASLPPVYGNGAIEAPMARVRSVLESRRWTFRNRARMDLLLELVRLADLRADDPGVYAADIRAHLLAHAGRPTRTYRAIYDSWGPKDAEQRTYSLWASPAERAARELRNAERKKTGRPPKPPRTTNKTAGHSRPAGQSGHSSTGRGPDSVPRKMR
jgi:hypothetical protein